LSNQFIDGTRRQVAVVLDETKKKTVFRKSDDDTEKNGCMVMCCAREVLERLCKVYTRSAALLQQDAIARNKALVKVRN